MLNITIGKKIPINISDTIVDGLSGSFNEGLLFILKSEDLGQEEINLFNTSHMSFDLLELNFYKDVVGPIYAFSILIDGLIDNSEIFFDFKYKNLNEFLPERFIHGGIPTNFILCNENDEVLAIRSFSLNTSFSNIISKKAYSQATSEISEDYTNYISLAFQEIFKNEPEENLKLYSIGNCII